MNELSIPVLEWEGNELQILVLIFLHPAPMIPSGIWHLLFEIRPGCNTLISVHDYAFCSQFGTSSKSLTFSECDTLMALCATKTFKKFATMLAIPASLQFFIGKRQKSGFTY
jgi:hypothetical protein